MFTSGQYLTVTFKTAAARGTSINQSIKSSHRRRNCDASPTSVFISAKAHDIQGVKRVY